MMKRNSIYTLVISLFLLFSKNRSTETCIKRQVISASIIADKIKPIDFDGLRWFNYSQKLSKTFSDQWHGNIRMKFWPPIYSSPCEDQNLGETNKFSKGRGSNLAHKEVWDSFYRNRRSCGIESNDVHMVFEFDAFMGLAKGGQNLTLQYIRKTSTDLIFLGYCYKKPHDHPRLSGAAPYCLHAYAITLGGAKKLLDLVDACSIYADAQVAILANAKKISWSYVNHTYDKAYISQKFMQEGIHVSGSFQYDGIFVQAKFDDHPGSIEDGTVCHRGGAGRRLFYMLNSTWRAIRDIDQFSSLGLDFKSIKHFTDWQFKIYPEGAEMCDTDVMYAKSLTQIANSSSSLSLAVSKRSTVMSSSLSGLGSGHADRHVAAHIVRQQYSRGQHRQPSSAAIVSGNGGVMHVTDGRDNSNGAVEKSQIKRPQTKRKAFNFKRGSDGLTRHVLFLGDSLTECGRDMRRKPIPEGVLGSCYPLLVSSYLEYNYPGVYTFSNRGHHSFGHLSAVAETWSIANMSTQKPSVVSIFTGIDDLINGFSKFDVSTFESAYENLVSSIQAVQKAGNCSIIIMTPFLPPGYVPTAHGKEAWIEKLSEVSERLSAIAAKYGTHLVDLFSLFRSAPVAKRIPISRSQSSNWLFDGHHFTYAAHQIIANAWISVFQESRDVPIALSSPPVFSTAASVSSDRGSRASASPIATRASAAPSILRRKMRMLFIGDSITDGYRKGHFADKCDPPSNNIRGSFVYLVAADLGLKYPELELSITNHGSAGATVHTLRKSSQQSAALAVKPDFINILIGVNDVWHTMAMEHSVMMEFAAEYDGLIADIRNALPNTTLVMCEPFILPGDHASRQGNWTRWKSRMTLAQAIVQRLAKKYNGYAVAFQPVLDKAAADHPPADLWLFDSIHPTFGGRRLLADEWLRTIHSLEV